MVGKLPVHAPSEAVCSGDVLVRALEEGDIVDCPFRILLEKGFDCGRVQKLI